MAGPIIEARGVSRTYGRDGAAVAALRGVSLAIEAGSFVSVMGASGSGKSTRLHLLEGLDAADRGELIVDGLDLSKLDDDALTAFRRRNIGFVFQAFNLLATLNALDNVLLPVMLERRVRPVDRSRAEELLREMGLEQRAGHGVDQLSGGEMQRVAIARALILSPRVILADEPTGNLDSRTGEAILTRLRSSCEQRGATVVMVTHDRNAADFGDRIVTLSDGRVVSDRTTESVALRVGTRGWHFDRSGSSSSDRPSRSSWPASVSPRSCARRGGWAGCCEA